MTLCPHCGEMTVIVLLCPGKPRMVCKSCKQTIKDDDADTDGN